MTFDKLIEKAQAARKAFVGALVPVSTYLAVELGPDHRVTLAVASVLAFFGVYQVRNRAR